LFGVVVRAFGLYSIVLGASAIHAVIQVLGVRTMGYYEWQPAAAFASLYIVAGIVLLRKSDLIVDFAYPVHVLRPSENSD
jgi:uncharacterized ion transporter superfamily protein YfcC